MRRSVLLCLCIVAIAWITRLAGAPSGEPVGYNYKIDSQPPGNATNTSVSNTIASRWAFRQGRLAALLRPTLYYLRLCVRDS